ncbi:hypothetical protein LCGC14_1840260, partial [marine sediment metagenome]
YKPEDSFWLIESHNRKYKDKNGNYKKGEGWRQDWDGTISTVCYNKAKCKCNIPKSKTHFPTGLLSKGMKFLDEHKVKYSLQDIRKKSPTSNVLSLSDEFEQRDYQIDVIKKSIHAQRGIIRAATGSGKTPIAAGLISELGVFPTIFYVPSIDLAIQAKNEIEKFVRKNGVPVEVGMVGGGHKEIKDITVMTIQTAVKALGGVWVKYDEEDIAKDETDINDIRQEIKDLIKTTKLMIGDECQYWAAETCQIISDNSISAQYRYAFSATPWRDKGDDILIDGCFGKCISNISASFLIQRGYLVKPTIYLITIKNMLGIKAIVENELRNKWISDMAISLAEQGKNILILCKQIKHGKILENLIPGSTFIHGSHSGKKREEHLIKMRSGEKRLTISSVIFDEGINCCPLDTLILAGGGKSPTRALQRIGRVLRPFPGKEEATVLDFMDHCKYMLGQSRKRLKIYKTEPEFVFKNWP